MADEDKKAGPGLSNNSFIVAALVASGAYYFYAMAPLQVSRPIVSEPQIHERFDGQDIESRLWQDPFAAVARAIESKHEPPDFDCGTVLSGKQKEHAASDHEAQHCNSPLFDDAGKLREGRKNAIVLGVTVSGAPYYEDGETRRRLRYAVLSGLHAEGYAPDDEQHLGYFRPLNDAKIPLPETIPYEWLQPDHWSKGDEGNRREAKTLRPVLVLWIDEDVLARNGKPLEQIARLKDSLCTQGFVEDQQRSAPATKKITVCDKIDFRIIGPYGSTVLEAMTREPTKEDKENSKPQAKSRISEDGAKSVSVDQRVHYYSAGATISDEDMERRRKDVEVFRTIAQDDVLASELFEELKRRGVEPGKDAKVSPCDKDKNRACPGRQHIALVSDYDTTYGRSIVQAFARKRPCSHTANESPPWIHRRTYLRGMDGALPPTNAGGEKSAKKNGDKDAAKEREESKALERPFGQGQFDYLRRLAASLKAEDDELRLRGEGGIRAIGVLGNDVFDKLLALRALKPLFPEAVFFTTDYDATLAAPNEIEWSRNLIVASGYGPTLAEDLQGDVPPFRSTYQASAFLATRLAIDEALNKAGKKNDAEALRKRIEEGRVSPRLFEIDRKGDFLALPIPSGEKADKSVHPNFLPLYPQLPEEARLGFALALAASAGVILSIYVRRRSSSFMGLRHAWNAIIVTLVVLALIFLWWEDFGNWATEFGRGEPIAWTTGVSVWPAVAIRAFAAVIAFGLIFDALDYLKRNLEEDVRVKLHIANETDRAIADGAAQPPASLREKFMRIFSYSLRDSDDNNLKYIDVDDVWNYYVAREAFVPRLARVMAFVLIMALFFVFLCVIYGWPQAPWRGALGWIYYATMAPLLFCALFLVFLVFDSTLLCLRFVDILGHFDTRWLDETRAAFVNHLKVKDRLIDDWIDLVFIARRTRCISKLIYYPFAILALMIVSRSVVFDAFSPSAPIVITQVIGFLIVFCCALTLGVAAEEARSRAKRNIAEGIIRARALDPSGPKAAQLESLLRLVNELREGFFVPLSQQAPIRALLLPLGGLGWTALVEYRLLPGL